MNSAEKKHLLQEIPQIVFSDDLERIKDFHRRSQMSIRLHFCAHLGFVRFHSTQGDWTLAAAELWRMSCSPMATVSRRLGLNQNRRFFGLGPLRE